VKHCAAAERIWFQRTLAGRHPDDCTGHAVGGDASFHVADHQTLNDVVAEYKEMRRMRDIANEAAPRHGVSLSFHTRLGISISTAGSWHGD
jgi:Protein of unknown function (DUF664)